MRNEILAAGIVLLTVGEAAAAGDAETPRYAMVSRAQTEVRFESAAWRIAREEVFGAAAGSTLAFVPNQTSGNGDEERGRCALQRNGSDLSSSEACIECHRNSASHGSSHPVNIPYAVAQARSGGMLRPLDAVIARGVFVPDGVVQCTSCHDARSPWKHHIALPPGAHARMAVNPRRPETYEGRSSWRLASAGAAPSLPRGSAVSPAPLCAACHALAD